MKNVISKKAISLIIILSIIIILFIVANIFINNNLIKQTISETLRQVEEEIVLDEISCKVLDNTSEKIKAFVVITREKGIEKIEYVASNEENIVLNCNNKQKITIDIEMLVNEEQQFKVTSNGEEKIETVILNENYIDEYIKYVKLDNDEPYDQIDIEFNPVQPSLNYYKINNGAWNMYSSTLALDISNVVLEKLQNNEYDITIYTMSVDSAGNVLQTNKIIELTKRCPNFNLFHNMDISGKTNLAEYGISGWWNYNHNTGVGDLRNFSVRNMGIYLRQSWNIGNNVSASFTIDI